MNLDPIVQDQLHIALNQISDCPTDNNSIQEATNFCMNFRDSDELLYIFYLIAHLGRADVTSKSRAVSAIYVFNYLHKKTAEQQRRFNTFWVQSIDISIRDILRIHATNGLLEGGSNAHHYAQLLGIFYAIEFPNFYVMELDQLISALTTSQIEEEQILIVKTLKNFMQYSLELNPNCSLDQGFYQIAPTLFSLLLDCMVDQNTQVLPHEAADAMTIALMFFKRTISFDPPRDSLIEVINNFMQSDNEDTYKDGYKIARKIVDNFYPLIQSYFKEILTIIQLHLKSQDVKHQVEACLLLQTFGDVESDILNPNKLSIKPRHREFDQTKSYSVEALNLLFEDLVQMIISCPVDNTTDPIEVDGNPQMAAFACLSNLAKAADSYALEPIFSFVKMYGENPDWRYRFASVLLLNAATRLSSFTSQSSNILIAFQFFIQAFGDTVPRVVEVGMWSLGRIILDVPDLVADPDRFNCIFLNVPNVLTYSATLAARCCWLLGQCFKAFEGRDEEVLQLLGQSFETYSNLLLNVTDAYDDDTSSAAYGALNDLVVYAPPNILEAYNNLFEKVTKRLGELLEKNNGNTLVGTQMNHCIWICSIIQTITIYIGDRVSPISGDLMDMLLQLLQASNGELIPEVLPAIGAVARAIKNEFIVYANDLMKYISELLEMNLYIQPATVLVGDIFSSIESIDIETANKFVALIFSAFNYPNLSRENKNAMMSVLGTQIAPAVGTECIPWLDQLLERLEAESKETIEEHDEATDFDAAKAIHITALLCFENLVPILNQVPHGFRRVRNFFYIFDQINSVTKEDPQVLAQAVYLIGLIAQTFGRVLNVVLNKPVVIKLLECGSRSDNDELAEMSQQYLQLVRSC